MTLTAGQTLAEVNGRGTVWLNAAVPEAIAGPLKPGQGVQATLAAFPGEIISGRVAVILPETQADSRTLTVRIELPNRGGRVRPGMRSEERRGGKECVRTCRSWVSRYDYKKKDRTKDTS